MDGEKNRGKRQAVANQGRDEWPEYVLVRSERNGKILEILGDRID